MSFIDRTYFHGDLHISGLSTTPVQEKLNHFISVYEPKCLEELFGYEFKKEFTTGLLEAVPAQKWIDLRDGAEFTGYNGRLKKWIGLTGNANAIPVSAGFRASEQIQVDVTTGFTSGTASVVFDGTGGRPDYRGWKIIPERIGQGTMWNQSYSWNASSGTWQLLSSGDSFQPLEKFNITFEPVGTAGTITTAVKQSIIANYVYYWWMRDSISSSTGVGEAKPAADNAASDSPAWKMFRAWEQMREWICDLDEFLRQNRADYPNYLFHEQPSSFRHTVNPFGI